MNGISQEKPRILLAEDAIVNAMLIGDMLAQLGCAVDVVEDGKQAVDRALEKKYDLVFMDLSMPVMDGLEATGLILAALGTDAPPVVALSAADTQDQVDACMAAGMQGFVHKPVRLDDLRAALDRWLSGAPESVAGNAPPVQTAGAVGFDPSFLDALAVKTPDKAARFARMTQDGAAALVADMDHALSAHDAAALVRAAHALKSVAGQVGAQALSEQARLLENGAAAMTAEGRAEAVSAVHVLFDRMVALLARYHGNTAAAAG